MKIEANRKGNLVIGIVFLVMAALFCFISVMAATEVFAPGEEDPVGGIAAVVVLLLVPAFFLWGGIYLIREARRGLPLIEITDTYFIDHSSAVAYGEIAWSDMERVYLKGTYLCIKLRDPDVYMARKGAIARLFIRGNRRLGYGDACICPAQCFPREASAFFDAFFKHRLPDNVK